MAHRYELLRTMFETEWKKVQLQNGISPENLLVKTRANRGHKLQEQKQDFEYNRSMIAVEINNEMLEENVSNITGSKLVRAAAKVAEQKRLENERTLSA